MPATDPAALAERVAAAVLAHPAVARLDGGPFGSTVASYLPGRLLPGVRVGEGEEPAVVAVVVRWGTALPRLAEELGAAVREVLGPVPVEVLFSDVEPPAGPAAAAPVAGRRGHRPLA